MAFPSDINLPGSSRYYTFIETKKNFNSNYDITWSFSYYLPASSIQSHNNYQLGFSTFLTSLESPVSSLPGQYLGDQDPEFILSAHGEPARRALLRPPRRRAQLFGPPLQQHAQVLLFRAAAGFCAGVRPGHLSHDHR